MTDPINLQIKRADNQYDIIEAAPVLLEEGGKVISTGRYELYYGFPEFDTLLPDADEMRERYVENMQIRGEANPDFLGELHFTGVAYFEWRYLGDQLNESEVLQIVDCIQDFAAGRVPLSANGIVLPKPELPVEVPLSFQFGRNRITYRVRLEETEGHFIVFINEEAIAKIELLEQDWEVTGGDIFDSDLKAEIIRRIIANS